MKKTSFPPEGAEILKRYGLSQEQVIPVIFQKGETVLEQGYTVPALYFIVSGSSRIQTYSSDGRMLSFGEAGPGSALGEMELLLEQDNSCNTVLATARTVCLSLPFETARKLIRVNAALAYQLGHNAATIWWYRNNNYVSALSADAMTRLCAFLLQNETDGIITVPLTEITYAVSTSYRHLLRLMGALVSDGVLSKAGRKYRIEDRGRLTAMSEI